MFRNVRLMEHTKRKIKYSTKAKKEKLKWCKLRSMSKCAHTSSYLAENIFEISPGWDILRNTNC